MTQSLAIFHGNARYFSVLILSLLLCSCVSTPPYQEMSDARQALSLAEQAGAAEHEPQRFAKARDLLALAKTKMDKGHYSAARVDARRARELAIRLMDELKRLNQP